ncbi:type I restriction-modification system subunit M [Mesorhizobium sp. AR02]|uniref:type I restriction-modification system subunit M n=1 Tax=Mesorhizobium sp. AR02 TaxID=2865837 RepID=UPI00215F9FD3|nr:type I restriction-modification system subunit M [Mesorhizobium sp. AR02]UVK54920.1 type I restriction-modification system subunit M [Mesorhizobium sp. AR02]
MNDQLQKQLGKTLWNIADQLRGAMNADDFRDYMLSFLFLRYLSYNYEAAAKRELGSDYPDLPDDVLKRSGASTPLQAWYEENPNDVTEFEKQMRRKVHYVIQPPYLWNNIANLARTQSDELLLTLYEGFKYIENESFQSTFSGLFSEINLYSEKLGKTQTEKNKKLCAIIAEIARGLAKFSSEVDNLGDAYEYLIGQFAAGSGKKAGEFYTPQQISDILSSIVTLDSHEPATGKKDRLASVLDFACGSGSLLLNVRKRMGPHGIGKIYGQESNITTYNLARMNMLLHGVKDTEFEIFHGDTLANDWDMLREMNPAKKPAFDAIVANPPFSLRWEPTDAMGDDVRFKNYGLAPKSAADFSFLLHGFHYLKDEGVMAIILPHGVLFRGGAEERIRTKLLKDGHIDTVIGLPANLFYSTGIPVCILVLKKCKKPDDVLFINAAGLEHFDKGKRQNQLAEKHINKIVETYQFRKEEDRYSKRVSMERIAEEGYNLNISRYISTTEQELDIDLLATHEELVAVEKRIREATAKHNAFLRELGKRSFPRTLTALATTDRFQTDASGQAAAALRKLKGRRSSIATFSGR